MAPIFSLVTLQRRSEFLRVRNGLRWATTAFVLEARTRDGWLAPTLVPVDIARFGFTVTKKLGSAVRRNRIKRRLKAAIVSAAAKHAKPGFDYVIIAREQAGLRAFESLLADFQTAFTKVHSQRPQSSGRSSVSKTNNSPAA